MYYRRLLIFAIALSVSLVASAQDVQLLQAALDQGQTAVIPTGDLVLESSLRITKDGAGIVGYGRIVQMNPDANIIEITANGVRLEGITLLRPADRPESTASAIRAENCQDLTLEHVNVLDNRSNAGAISFDNCRNARVANCSITNYKRIAIDDRTASELYGYAFRVIDGTGILASRCRDLQIASNRVTENNIIPTQETKDKYRLGQLTEGKNPTKKGPLSPQGDYANNWHQGSAITVTSPEETDHVLISGNSIVNAAQGIDMHADHVTCSNNSIDHAFIGIKCMHGARNVIISGNNISHVDLWGLVMMPGTASHPAEAATPERPARGPNFTRGNIIANNIFSDFGYGHEYYNWKDTRSGVICLDSGQLPENPVMTDVLIQGNIVYDSGKDQIIADGQPVTDPPRYEFCVFIATNPKPEGLVFEANIFHPGRGGISNVPLF